MQRYPKAYLIELAYPFTKLREQMWMGTYPELPSYVLSSGEDLQDVLNANREKLIGKPVLSKFGTDLPFLPKVRKSMPFTVAWFSGANICVVC